MPGDDLYSVGAAVTMSGRIPRVSGWTQPDGPGHHDRDSTHEILRGRCGVGMVRIGCIADYMGGRGTLTADISEKWSNWKRLEDLESLRMRGK